MVPNWRRRLAISPLGPRSLASTSKAGPQLGRLIAHAAAPPEPFHFLQGDDVGVAHGFGDALKGSRSTRPSRPQAKRIL
jgi:hypothetical protein